MELSVVAFVHIPKFELFANQKYKAYGILYRSNISRFIAIFDELGLFNMAAKSTSKDYDVIITGAGPAGSTCAMFLARKGVKVLLLDRATFPRDKTCGDAISGKSARVLKELGLDKDLEKKDHAKIYGVVLSSPNGSIVEIPIPKQSDGKVRYGYCARRMVYDNFLFENAKKMVDTVEKFNVTDIITENDFVVGVKGTDLNTNEEKEYRAKMVVGADGAHSVIAKKLKVDEVDDSHYVSAIRAYYKGVEGMKGMIEIHFVEDLMPGYFWIFPLENGLANVGVGMLFKDMKKKKVSLKDSMFRAIENNSLFKERFKNAKIEGEVKGWTLPLGSKHRKLTFNGCLLLGDAASLIDPFTGEGVGNAMTSGQIASGVIETALKENNFSEQFLQDYEQKLWTKLDPELKTSYKLQRLGSSKFLLNFIMGKAAKKEKIREVISHTLVEEVPLKNIISTFGLLKLLFM